MKNFLFFNKMNRAAIIAMTTMFIASTTNAQIQIAVFDFKAGAGVEQNEVDGISAIFSTYFMDPQKFTLVERSQIDRVIVEQGFQHSSLTSQQMVKVGQILNIQKMVVGDINIVNGQYNVDVRMVNVETGTVEATEGATWVKGISYRDLMQNLAKKLITKMSLTNTAIQNTSSIDTPSTIVILYGYLKVYPEDIGDFPSIPKNVIEAINNNVSIGYNDWRVPTTEEVALIKANKSKIAGIGSGEYMTSDGQPSGVLRLVTTGKTFAEKEKLRIEQELEQKRLVEEQQKKQENERILAEERAACGLVFMSESGEILLSPKIFKESLDISDCNCPSGWRFPTLEEVSCLSLSFSQLALYSFILRTEAEFLEKGIDYKLFVAEKYSSSWIEQHYGGFTYVYAWGKGSTKIGMRDNRDNGAMIRRLCVKNK